jgi:opacity protein-like surface antigen
MKHHFILILFLFSSFIGYSQILFGAGISYGYDTYQRYVNPIHPADSGIARGAGNTLTNLSIGPKIWIGHEDFENFSFSVESNANIGLTALSIRDFKGLGALAFPILGHFNFYGLSSFSEEDFGFAVGGGIQYNRTELFGVRRSYAGLERSFFPTYVGEIQFGLNVEGGFMAVLYTRYGVGPNQSSSLNIGATLAVNIVGLMNY